MPNQEHVVNETFQKSIATLMEKGKKGELDTSKAHVTSPLILSSNAGYYIGTWCVEFDHGEWAAFPNERLSDYGTLERMIKALPHY